MSCDCYLASLLIEYRGSKDGSASNQGGEIITSDSTSQNTKEVATFSNGSTRTTDYSTDIKTGSATGSSTFPPVNVVWSGVSGGTYVRSVWSNPVEMSEVRSHARGACSYTTWGTPPPFGGWTADNPQPSDAMPDQYQWSWLLVRQPEWDGVDLSGWASLIDLIAAQTTDNTVFSGGSAVDSAGLTDGVGPTGVDGIPAYALGALCMKGQFRFTLGLPMIPIKLKWDIVDSTTGTTISSDDVTLDSGSPTHDVDLTAGTPSGNDDKSVRMANLHIFACPYHLAT